MPLWVGDGAVEPLLVEPVAGDDKVLVEVVELGKGAVELLVDPDVLLPLDPPGCCALTLPAMGDTGGGT